jgi:predicted polyphosphate/ATP-dependent NAD kinase
MRVGFVMNPIAGMGGRVGLKGTDNKVAEARARGATPQAREQALRALTTIADLNSEVSFLTWESPMGSEVLSDAGFDPMICGAPLQAVSTPFDTSAEDTIAAATKFVEKAVELVVFVGGDGTASDVGSVLEDTQIPMIGIPAGVKVYSSVFAVTPEDVGSILRGFDETESREVMDINEESYRSGTVQPEVNAVVKVPLSPQVQSAKASYAGDIDRLATGVAEDITADERLIILGPGGTIERIESELGVEGSPLGVDLYHDQTMIGRDVSETTILEAIHDHGGSHILVTPIGGQGFVFGRGNPQLSPSVLRQSEFSVVASKQKLDRLGQLRIDSGDPSLDESLRGWTRVRVGRYERRLMEIT